MTVQVKDSGAQLIPQKIHEFETLIGKALSYDFKSFLLEHNGGRFYPRDFSFCENGSTQISDVHHFYGLGAGNEKRDLSKIFRMFLDRPPPELIPIAGDSLGNQICISIGDNKNGFIYFWNHDDEHSPPTYRNVSEVASSFQAFIDGIYEHETETESQIEKAIKKDNVEFVSLMLNTAEDIEQLDQYGRSNLENAAIANAVGVIDYLFSRGAKLRNALALAEQNAEYFPEHQRSVSLLRRLAKLDS